MAVAVETQPKFTFRTPELLFKRAFPILHSFGASYTTYHFSRDGKRFLTMKQADMADEESNAAPTNKITIVLNWVEELKKKVPVD